MHFKVREDGRVCTKAVYTVLGINMQGNKEVLGLYQGDHESATVRGSTRVYAHSHTGKMLI
jgi:transposase-like protein